MTSYRRFLPLLLGCLFFIALAPPPAQAATLSWTTETIDSTGTYSVIQSARGLAPDSSPYPVVTVRETTADDQVFWSRETGSWVASTIVSKAGGTSAQYESSTGVWNAVSCAAGVPACSAAFSDDDGASWTGLASGFSAGTPTGVSSLDVSGETWAFFETTSTAGFYFVSTDGGATFGAAQLCNGGTGGPVAQVRLPGIFVDSNDDDVGAALWSTDDDCGTNPEVEENVFQTTPNLPGGFTAYITDGGGAAYAETGGVLRYVRNVFSGSPVTIASNMETVASHDVIDAEGVTVAVWRVGTNDYEMGVSYDGATFVTYDSLPITGAGNAGFPQISEGKIWVYWVDGTDLKVSYADLPSAPITPTPPAGLFVEVTVAQSEVQAQWFISSNDPDRDVGDYDYEIRINGVSVGTDTIGAGDGDGERTATISFGGFGEAAFQVRAINTTSGIESAWSCVAILELDDAGNQASCGTEPGGFLGTGEGGLPGLDLDEFAEGVGMSREAAGWLIGLLLTFGITAGMMAISPKLAILGGVLGIGVSTAFGLIPIWFILILVLLAAAVVVLRFRSAE